MKKMLLVSVALAASLTIAGCNRGAAPANNTAAAANKAAPAAPPAGNSAGGGNATGGGEGAGGGAAQQNFTFVNQSGQTVNTLQVSATGENEWGPDLLGRDTLANGESAQIVFERGDDRCFWDVRATGDAGELDMRNINLCETPSVTALPAG